MNYTNQQQEVITQISKGTGNLVIDARAGSSKTTMTVAGAEELPGSTSILAVAFNRDIAGELSERMPPQAACKTFNGLGHGAWIRHIDKKVDLDKRKTWRLKNAIDNHPWPSFGNYIGLLKAHGVVPKGALAQPKGLLKDEPETYTRIADLYGIDSNGHPDPIGVAREVLLRSISEGWQGKIDYDDQLYLPTIFRAGLAKADVVMVDEAQDVSLIQREMIHQIAKKSGRLIAVGDRYQAIYGFRGAMSDSIPRLIEDFSAEVLPLTTSFRCPKAVIKEARKYVGDIEAWEHADEGLVENWGQDWNADFFEGENVYEDTIAVLCRNNAPLVALCFHLIANRIGAVIRGRDTFNQLTKLIDKAKASDAKELLRWISDHEASETYKLREKGCDSAAELLSDKCKAIMVIAQQVDGVGDVKVILDEMFNDKKNPPVLLSTVHKAKGLEWPNVVILDPQLMPSRWASTPEELQQERNLQYVATTRAQQTLTMIQTHGVE